jgi:predicted ATP-grasp superfamily ATP-dependent carboligase
VSDLERILDSLSFETAVLITCSDRWTLEAARISAPLMKRFRVCAPAWDVLRRFVNKGQFAELVRSAQVPHPFTVVAKTEGELRELARESGDRLFLKPMDSQMFLQKFGKKAFRLDDLGRAVEVFARAREAGLGLLVQEYIPGASDRHYFVDGFVRRDHAIHAAFGRRRLRMFPLEFGNSSYMISVPIGEVAEGVDTLEKLFDRAGYRGVFSAEFKFDERDGHLKILEVNCRPWWYVQFTAECGVNVVDMAYRDALDLPLPDPGEYESGARLVYPYYDAQALKQIRRAGKPVLREYLTCWPGAMTPVFAWDDPAPAASEIVSRLRDRFSRHR